MYVHDGADRRMGVANMCTYVHVYTAQYSIARGARVARPYEIKNTKFYSNGCKVTYTKICTIENFPLYGKLCIGMWSCIYTVQGIKSVTFPLSSVPLKRYFTASVCRFITCTLSLNFRSVSAPRRFASICAYVRTYTCS